MAFYEDVRVPFENLVGEENRGWYVGMTLLDFERSNISGAVSARRSIEQLIDHVKSAAGRAQTEHGALTRARAAIADRAIETEVLLNFSLRIVTMQANGMFPNYEASTAKLFNSELAQNLARTGMKVFGLYSNLWDPDDPQAPVKAQFTQRYVHTVVFTIFGGASEIQRNIIATRGLGLPRA